MKPELKKALVLMLEGWIENAGGRDSWFRGLEGGCGGG